MSPCGSADGAGQLEGLKLLNVFGDSSAQALDADGLQLYGGTLLAVAHFVVDAVLLADEQ